jgi:hypothetical protein
VDQVGVNAPFWVVEFADGDALLLVIGVNQKSSLENNINAYSREDQRR